LNFAVLTSDLKPALLVIELSCSFRAVFVNQSPGSSRTAHHAENSYFQDLLAVCKAYKRSCSENIDCNPNEEIATAKLNCTHILSFPARVIDARKRRPRDESRYP